MTRKPLTVGPEDSAAVAKGLLESHDIHHLPVAVDGVLVGILSSADFLKLHVLSGSAQSLESVTVSQIMEAEPVTLDIFADLVDVASKLAEGGFHSIPVVEGDNVLIGIVTSTDLINHLMMQVPRTASGN
jgi:CBS domain-containing protein